LQIEHRHEQTTKHELVAIVFPLSHPLRRSLLFPAVPSPKQTPPGAWFDFDDWLEWKWDVVVKSRSDFSQWKQSEIPILKEISGNYVGQKPKNEKKSVNKHRIQMQKQIYITHND
jgi:hypothetical protein